jgi:hypothetical protein
VADQCLACAPYLSLCGVAVLAGNLILSFEEPHTGLLTTSAILLLGGPLAMLGHFALTPDLTGAEKRLWVRAVWSRSGVRVLGAYFNPAARARVTRELTERAQSD